MEGREESPTGGRASEAATRGGARVVVDGLFGQPLQNSPVQPASQPTCQRQPSRHSAACCDLVFVASLPPLSSVSASGAPSLPPSLSRSRLPRMPVRRAEVK